MGTCAIPPSETPQLTSLLRTQFPDPAPATSLDDAGLARQMRAGDPHAFAALYDRHARTVHGLAYRMLRDHRAAEDVTQDAFLMMWRSREAYSPERGALRTWLLTITRNRTIDVIRRRRDVLHQDPDFQPEQEAPERTEDEVLRRAESGTVNEALSALPSTQRRVLELAYFGGLTHAEIAAHLQVPLGTVKSRLRLALRKLAGFLEPPAAALN